MKKKSSLSIAEKHAEVYCSKAGISTNEAIEKAREILFLLSMNHGEIFTRRSLLARKCIIFRLADRILTADVHDSICLSSKKNWSDRIVSTDLRIEKKTLFSIDLVLCIYLPVTQVHRWIRIILFNSQSRSVCSVSSEERERRERSKSQVIVSFVQRARERRALNVGFSRCHSREIFATQIDDDLGKFP